ncbi:hypothetical protein K0M31_019548, partial [Melipona bicolor]
SNNRSFSHLDVRYNVALRKKRRRQSRVLWSGSSPQDSFADGCTRVKLAWQHLSSGKKAGKKHRQISSSHLVAFMIGFPPTCFFLFNYTR